jgi:hypothetical protein
MSVLVCNTSPLILSAKVGLLPLLPQWLNLAYDEDHRDEIALLVAD